MKRIFFMTVLFCLLIVGGLVFFAVFTYKKMQQIEKLLLESIAAKEIKEIDTAAYAILLGSIGRDFAAKENKKKISKSPEETANSITDLILSGIKLES